MSRRRTILEDGGRAAWKAFALKSFYYGDVEAMRGGPDPSSLLELDGEQREAAIDMLIAGLRYDDSIAPLGLRVLHATRAVAELEAWLPSASPAGRVQTALALRVLTDNQEYAAPIIEVLQDSQSWWSMDAAIALRRFSTPESVEALYQALTDDRFLVRYHSAESLLSVHGLNPPSLDPRSELFQALAAGGRNHPTSEDRQRFATVRPLMQELLQGRAAAG